MLARVAFVILAVLAEVGGLVTWEFVALLLSGAALVIAVAAIVMAQRALTGAVRMDRNQSARLDVLEQNDGG